MASEGDNLAVRIQTNVDGVATFNEFFLNLTDLGDSPTASAMLLQILAAYWQAIQPVLSTSVSLTCGVLLNLTTDTKEAISFPAGLNGLAVSGPHPQSQVIRINKKAQELRQDPITNASMSISGVAKEFSTRGRFNDPTELDAIQDFLRDEITIGTGWTLQPIARSTTLRGFHVGLDGSAELEAFPNSFIASALVGFNVVDVNDRSRGIITANTTDTITATLTGGTDNDWDNDDQYGVADQPAYFPTMRMVQANMKFLKLRGRTAKICGVR